MITWNKRAARRDEEHHAHEINCTSLCCARRGQSVCIKSFCGDEAETCRLREMGLREGCKVTVLRHGDPFIVRINDSRLGLGRAAATNVLCELLETTS